MKNLVLVILCFSAGKTHIEAAQLIAKSYADPLNCEMKLIVTANSFRPNANLYRPNSW